MTKKRLANVDVTADAEMTSNAPADRNAVAVATSKPTKKDRLEMMVFFYGSHLLNKIRIFDWPKSQKVFE